MGPCWHRPALGIRGGFVYRDYPASVSRHAADPSRGHEQISRPAQDAPKSVPPARLGREIRTLAL